MEQNSNYPIITELTEEEFEVKRIKYNQLIIKEISNGNIEVYRQEFKPDVVPKLFSITHTKTYKPSQNSKLDLSYFIDDANQRIMNNHWRRHMNDNTDKILESDFIYEASSAEVLEFIWKQERDKEIDRMMLKKLQEDIDCGNPDDFLDDYDRERYYIGHY
jgi:hypothetical protein